MTITEAIVHARQLLRETASGSGHHRSQMLQAREREALAKLIDIAAARLRDGGPSHVLRKEATP